jgi:putative ABC transport system ATP-binding protein
MEEVGAFRRTFSFGMPRSRHAVEARHVSKVYQGPKENEVYTDLSLQILRGDFVVLLGPVGSGKTTLLNLLAGLERPTSGSITIDGTDITYLRDDQVTAFRAETIGLVPQVQNLVDHLSVYSNVELPLHFLGIKKDERRDKVDRVLERIGLGGDEDRVVGTLSVGEKQLVAIARALVHDPPVILLDEPTEALDPLISEVVFEFLKGDNMTKGKTVVAATHDKRLVELARKTVRLRKKLP